MPEPSHAPRRPRPKNVSRDCLAAAHYPDVRLIARAVARAMPAHVEIDDLVSAGALGLMEAAERFDPARGHRFKSFARLRIRGAMLDDLRARDSLTRVMRGVSNEMRDGTRALEALLGRAPTADELARRLGIGVEELYARQKDLSGSTVVGLGDDQDDGGVLGRTVVAPVFEDPFDAAARGETLAALAQSLEALSTRHQQVLSLLYGEGLFMREVGEALGVTESRVCQIHREAVDLLRQSLDPQLAEGLAA